MRLHRPELSPQRGSVGDPAPHDAKGFSSHSRAIHAIDAAHKPPTPPPRATRWLPSCRPSWKSAAHVQRSESKRPSAFHLTGGSHQDGGLQHATEVVNNQVGTGSAPNRPWTDHGSCPHRPRIGPGSRTNRPRIQPERRPGSTPDPGSTLEIGAHIDPEPDRARIAS